MANDREQFHALEAQIQALQKSDPQLLQTIEALLGAAVDKALELGEKHGPELIAAVVEGVTRAAVSRGLEELQ